MFLLELILNYFFGPNVSEKHNLDSLFDTTHSLQKGKV